MTLDFNNDLSTNIDWSGLSRSDT